MQVKSRIENNLFISDNTYAKLFGSINNYTNNKVVSWYPGIDIGFYALALHETNNSKIKVLSLSSDDSNQNDSELGMY